MRKILIAVIILILFILSLFYFDLPFNLLRPVFHQHTINKYAKLYGQDPLLVTAIIKVESNFFKLARSNDGAIGLMQLMPATAKEIYSELGMSNFNPKNLENPDTNIKLGTYYITKLQKDFKGSQVLAIASYNAGESKVQSWYMQNPLSEIEITDIPYKETRNYVKEVTKIYRWLKLLKEFKNLIRGEIS